MEDKSFKELSVRERIMGQIPPWSRWGPYVSERAWGTVREDYSTDGNSWRYFPFEMAKSKAYRWGEDGIAGICDRYQVLVFSMAFWNGKDPILKERLFGVNPYQGNHGEDIKEYFFYLDNNPDHTYMKYLYKYPCARFPYEQLIEENQKRSMQQPEYELIDTQVFKENRYFDIFIEYAKASPEDICIRISVHNRGPDTAGIHIVPHLFYRNFWRTEIVKEKPHLYLGEESNDFLSIIADDAKCDPIPLLNYPYRLGKRFLYASSGGKALFTDNESNEEYLGRGKNSSPYVKDAFHRYVINGENCVSPENRGTKSCVHYANVQIPAHSSHTIRMRLTDAALKTPLEEIDHIIEKRKKETDSFYEKIHPKHVSEEEKLIQRQALAGLLWSKQIYLFNVSEWFRGDHEHPTFPEKELIRNQHWKHLISKRILSVPDKWEFPWFAAWDLAFHCISLALVDIEFAKEQLWLLLFDQFQHPNGQIPAYEWEFSDLNPPVQAWGAWNIYQMEFKNKGKKDKSFLKKCFHKLILNFVWWVNRVDKHGNNVFEGGFLGLDNITIIDRSMPGEFTIEQSDGTGWMGMFCLMLMRIALELAADDPDYEAMAVKFFEHFVYIAAAISNSPNRSVQIWNKEEGFFYDVMNYPDKGQKQLFLRSLVGIIPLYAIDSIDEEELSKFPEFGTSVRWFLKNRQDLVGTCITPFENQEKKHYLLALVKLDQIKRVLQRVWDPSEFRSEFGLRSLSKYHLNNPFQYGDLRVGYEPGETEAFLKGGNSNWRGPIWFPTTYLLAHSLKKLHQIVGGEEKIQIPGEKPVTFEEMARYFAHAMIKIFKKDPEGKRPVFGKYPPFLEDPHWKDCLLFHEYYHGDHGWGLGASHQTGWSALVANFIDEFISK